MALALLDTKLNILPARPRHASGKCNRKAEVKVTDSSAIHPQMYPNPQKALC